MRNTFQVFFLFPLFIIFLKKYSLFISFDIGLKVKQRNFRYFLCGVFKQEGMYLKEWTQYHLNFGFDHVILINNNDNYIDDKDMIKELIKDTRITVYDRVGHKHNIPKWYEEVYRQLGINDWCLFADIDEFFMLKANWSLDYYFYSAKESGCTQIKLNWLVFGNNGHIIKTNGTLIERFPKPANNILRNSHVANTSTKPLLRGGMKNIKWNSWHHAIADGIKGCNGALKPLSEKENDNLSVFHPTFNVSYLSHYFTKSEQEWCLKMIRHNKKQKNNDYNWKLYNKVNYFKPNVVRTNQINGNCSYAPS